LDEAVLPSSPIRPNLFQNLILGGILGFLLGVGLIIFLEYLRIPTETSAIYNILDERSGIYDMRYFRERLHQEMSRVRRHKGVLSVALVNIDHRRLLGSVPPQTRLEVMRSVVMALGKSLRNEDVMASFSDTELALLLPDLDGESAKTAVERVLVVISKASVDLSQGGRNINLNGAAGVAPLYNWDRATTDVLITRAQNVLESIRESTYGKVMISNEGPVGSIPENNTVEAEDAKSTLVAQEQPEISEQEEIMALENLVIGLHEDEKMQEELVEETAAVQEPSEISEQGEMAASEEPVSHNHNGKKNQIHKATKNETGHNKLELSEQESG
ncbi:MAG TPA: GGDEF domain-containing protein, partial [Anaerolineales bacterium]|nr:GGDEF domain-containing protein [Anaerolineales bacterium]